MLSLAVCVIFIHTQILTWSDGTRIAATEALVKQKVFYIENTSVYELAGGDKFYVNGHFYASDNPMISIIGAVPYSILNIIFGESRGINDWPNYFLVVFFTIGISASLLVFFFYRSLKFFKLREYQRIILSFSVLFSTLIFSYSGHFMKHAPAALFMFLSFYYLIKPRFVNCSKRCSYMLSGLFAALTFNLDMPAGLMFLALFLGYLLMTKKLRKYCSFYIMGTIIPLIFYLVLNMYIFSTVTPPQIHDEYVIYPGSRWLRNPASVPFGSESDLIEILQKQSIPKNKINQVIAKYHEEYDEYNSPTAKAVTAFWYSFGRNGFFSYSPILIFSFIFMMTALLKKKYKLRKEAFIILVGSLITTSFYTFVPAIPVAGCSYGPRHMISIIPLVFFFTGIIYKERRTKIVMILFYLVLAISSIVAFIGTINPAVCDTFPILKIISNLIGKP